jgi:hypothetical protein
MVTPCQKIGVCMCGECNWPVIEFKNSVQDTPKPKNVKKPTSQFDRLREHVNNIRRDTFESGAGS